MKGWRVAVAAVVLVAAGVTPIVRSEATTGPIFTVMNTSETLPDGVYFRNSPYWDDTSRTSGLGVFMNEQVRLDCYAWGQAIGPYSNTLWYWTLNVTRPVNYDGQTNQGMLNAHYINDGLAANVIDAGVPACVNNRPPPPTTSPSVTLSQGPAAPAGYRYAIALTGFAANSSVSINCRDSVSPGGFYSFSLPTDGNGAAFTQSYCYSGDGPDHWVVAGGTYESNHVSWGTSSSGGGGTDPGTGGSTSPPHLAARPTGSIAFPSLPSIVQPLAPQPAPSTAERLKYAADLAEMRGLLLGCLEAGFYNCYNYGQHYLDASGTPKSVPIEALFNSVAGMVGQFQFWLRYNVGKLAPQLEATPTNSAYVSYFDTAGTTNNWYVFSITNKLTDWFWVLHGFSTRMKGNVWIGPADGSGVRPIQIQYRSFMCDKYDFDGDYHNLEDLALHGMAAEFLETGASITITVSTDTAHLDAQSLPLQW